MALHLPDVAHTFHVDGVEVTYYDSQQTHRREGTLVLVHGTGGSAAAHFTWLLPMLATRQRVIGLDMAMPRAVADGTRRLELDDLADQVIAVLEEVRPTGPVTLLGYSLGSPVVTRTASRRPELVDRMVHLNGFLSSDRHRAYRGRLWRRLFDLQDWESLRLFQFYSAFSPGFLESQEPELIEGIFERLSFDDFSGAQMELNSRIAIVEEAHALTQPTLVISSRDDLMVPPRAQDLQFAAFEDARLAEIGGGHASVIERPAQVARLVQDFLDHPTRHEAGTRIPEATV